MTPHPPPRPISYFPRAERLFRRAEANLQNLPVRPTAVAPIFDLDHANVPLQPFNHAQHSLNYGEGPPNATSSLVPDQPPTFTDAYLFPTLARNELLRLTMLWYYTRGITEDQELLQSLQGIVKLVQAFIGWEFVIMGILSENSYSRLATEGVPLAVLPRRESTCAHTINQKCGLFVLPNMATDWRFSNSPHVDQGGLRSYAGAPLHCETEDGESVALGSLCVAANTETEGLSTDKQAALKRFADILSAELVNRLRINRQRQRQVMSDALAKVKSQEDPRDVEDKIKEAISTIYPDATVSLQDSDDGFVRLENRLCIPFSDTHEGLWEDTEFLEALVLNSNYEQLKSDQTVRAIISRCRRHPNLRFLVVAFKEIQLVLDDVDAWFVEACGSILFDFYHERLLAEALAAKETFLRGITHQLRTPIHGILGSVELLGEELFSRASQTNGSSKETTDPGPLAASDLSKNARLYLQTITNSGRELMSTVNNMLMLNSWAASHRSMKPSSLYELNQLETDILRDIALMLPEDELASSPILFDNRLSLDCSIVTIDIQLLKECLQSLILNAVQATQDGCVLVQSSASSDYSVLRFDIKDTGTGIPQQDHRRIFTAYEKGDCHTRGVGLGLTISAKIADSMNGCVTLVSSKVGKGSHFRVELWEPGFACPVDQRPSSPVKLDDLPDTYYEIPSGEKATPLIRHFINFLEHRGFSRSKQSKGALNILSFMEEDRRFREHFEQADPDSVCICLIPSRVTATSLRLPSLYSKILFFEGPFLSVRLQEILQEVNGAYGKLKQRPDPTPITNGVPVGPNEPIHDVFARKMRIAEPLNALLVDDNVINLRIFKLYCEKRQIPYAIAVDGNEAVAQYKSYLQTQPFNLILMDMQMPNCDGIEATRQIREVEKSLGRRASVIFMITGQDSAQDKLQAKQAGVDEYYVKPMSLKTLNQGITQYFEPEIQRTSIG